RSRTSRKPAGTSTERYRGWSGKPPSIARRKPMALPDPTFDQVALADLRAKGVTCRSCEHWTARGFSRRGIDGECELDRPSFPRVCRFYEYEPGSDETIDHEEVRQSR